MKKQISVRVIRLALAYVVLAFALLGCGSSDASRTGGIEATLTLDAGATVKQIDAVTVTISCTGMDPITGLPWPTETFDVNVSTSEGNDPTDPKDALGIFKKEGLPEGSCTATLVATSSDGVMQCGGQMTDIPVVAGPDNTFVTIVINCITDARYGGIGVAGEFNQCAEYSQITVSPTTQSVSNDVDVDIWCYDPDGDDAEATILFATAASVAANPTNPAAWQHCGTNSATAFPPAPLPCPHMDPPTVPENQSTDTVVTCDRSNEPCLVIVSVSDDGFASGGTDPFGCTGQDDNANAVIPVYCHGSCANDTDPPVLLSFDINPKSADVSVGTPVEVTLRASVFDCSYPSGIIVGVFKGPSGQQANCLSDDLAACSVDIPPVPGVWEVEWINVVDSNNNWRIYSKRELQLLGFPTQFHALPFAPDPDPPVLTSFDLNPQIVNVAGGATSVTCSMTATDIGGGVTSASCYLRSPSGLQSQCTASATTSGDPSNGVWPCTAAIPGNAPEETWTVQRVSVRDLVANETSYDTSDLQALGAPTEFDVATTDPDPPVLTAFDFNPKTVEVTSGWDGVTCSMTATDGVGAGVGSAWCYFRSPSGLQGQQCEAVAPTSGDKFDGLWSCGVPVPHGSEPGAWTLVQVSVRDTAGNQRNYATSDLASLGSPTQLNVVSLNPDTEPPVLADFDFDPTSVDVTNDSAVVTCNMTLTDAGVGAQRALCYLRSPSGLQSTGCHHSQLASGDAYNGTWSCENGLYGGAAFGVWVVERVIVRDVLGNESNYDTADLQGLGFPVQLSVVSLDLGVDPPALTAFDFNPKMVDGTVGADVTFSRTIDAPTGWTVVFLESPSGESIQGPSLGIGDISCWFSYSPGTCLLPLPPGSELGAWSVRDVAISTDGPASQLAERLYSKYELQSLGFPTQLSVTYEGGLPP